MVGLYEGLLVGCSGTYRASRDAIDDGSFRSGALRALASRDVQEFFLRQAVVLEDVFLQLLHVLLEGAEFQLVAHDVEYVASAHDAELGIERLEHLHVGVVHAIEQKRVDVVDEDMLFNHSPIFNAKVIKIEE